MDAGHSEPSDVLHAAQRRGFYVGIPLYHVGRKRWEQYAYDNTVSGRGLRARGREWTVVGSTEEECIGEMARYLQEISEGRVPIG